MLGFNPNCLAKAEGEAKQPCPIGCYEEKNNCWQLDWKPLAEKASKEMVEWVIEKMKRDCTKCPVYDKRQNEIDELIKSIQNYLTTNFTS